MSQRAVFEGLIVDEKDRPVSTEYVGAEATYVVDDDGFMRHISSEYVDRQVLNFLKEQILQNKDILADQATKMLGQEDIFSRAVIENQLEDVDKQMDILLNTGLPISCFISSERAALISRPVASRYQKRVICSVSSISR